MGSCWAHGNHAGDEGNPLYDVGRAQPVLNMEFGEGRLTCLAPLSGGEPHRQLLAFEPGVQVYQAQATASDRAGCRATLRFCST